MQDRLDAGRGVAIGMAVCAAILAIGVFGPWIGVLNIKTYNGIQSGGFVAFVPAALVVWASIARLQGPGPRWPARLATFSFGFAFLWGPAVVGIILARIADAYGDNALGFIQVEWGVVLYSVGGLVGTILAIILWVRDGHQRSTQSRQREVGYGREDLRWRRESVPSRPGAARVSVIDGGRAHGAVALRSGARVVVGRSPEADIRISDPRASRRHLEISVDGWGYRLTDLGSTNPARIIAGGRPGQMHPGSQVTLPSGQVAIGESVITLYPFDDGYR